MHKKYHATYIQLSYLYYEHANMQRIFKQNKHALQNIMQHIFDYHIYITNMQIKYKYTYLQQITTKIQHALNLNLATTCNIKRPCNIYLRKTNMHLRISCNIY